MRNMLSALLETVTTSAILLHKATAHAHAHVFIHLFYTLTGAHLPYTRSRCIQVKGCDTGCHSGES